MSIDVEKAEMEEKLDEEPRGRLEEVEEQQNEIDPNDRLSAQIAKTEYQDSKEQQLDRARSRSSARSQRSYAGTDGYTHFTHDIAADIDNDDPNLSAPQDAVHPIDPDDDDAWKAFDVRFDGDADPMNPKNRAVWRKWAIVVILSTSSICVTCASALYTSTYRQMEREFHISREAATVGLSTFVCGLALGPMVLSPLSEFYGRRMVYICAFGMFLVWLIVSLVWCI